MKKITLILIIIVYIFPLLGKAQNTNADIEKIKAEKISFITNKMNLSVKEAQDFWPIYNEFEILNEALVSEELSITKELKQNVNILSDSEIDNKINRMFEIKKEKNNIEIKYFNDFKAVLPMQKVSILYSSEIEFRKHLIKRFFNQD